jgi:uncharacterized heparinase superfamily protein
VGLVVAAAHKQAEPAVLQRLRRQIRHRRRFSQLLEQQERRLAAAAALSCLLSATVFQVEVVGYHLGTICYNQEVAAVLCDQMAPLKVARQAQ